MNAPLTNTCYFQPGEQIRKDKRKIQGANDRTEDAKQGLG
jgi:hypothetical protein